MKDQMEIAARLLDSHFGELDDLPEELQDTLANVYFKGVELLEGQGPHGDDLDSIFSNMSKMTLASFDIGSLPKLIPPLRKLQSEPSENNRFIYDKFVVLILDIYKYQIKNASSKSAARRAVERKFSKPPQEIKGLYRMFRMLINKK